MNENTTDYKMKFIEFVPDFPVDKLIPYDLNPRENDHAVPVIEKSITTYGKINPIIVDVNFRICAGNTRFKACLKSGIETFPVMVYEFADENTFVAFNIADNQTASIADFIESDLSDVLYSLKNEDESELLKSLGFEDKELLTNIKEEVSHAV